MSIQGTYVPVVIKSSKIGEQCNLAAVKFNRRPSCLALVMPLCPTLLEYASSYIWNIFYVARQPQSLEDFVRKSEVQSLI